MRSRSMIIFAVGCAMGLGAALFGARYVTYSGMQMGGGLNTNSTAGKTISTNSRSHFSDFGTVFSSGKPRVRDDHYRKAPSQSDMIDTELDGTTMGSELTTEDIVPFDVDALTEGQGGLKSFKEILSIFIGSK